MISFTNLTKKKVSTSVFKKLYKKLFIKDKMELSVVFVSPTFMRKLNKTYRKKDKTANVLSFLLTNQKSKEFSGGQGEIFLNIKEPDLPHLFVHGCLHLKGYDHENDVDAGKMERRENKILNSL